MRLSCLAERGHDVPSLLLVLLLKADNTMQNPFLKSVCQSGFWTRYQFLGRKSVTPEFGYVSSFSLLFQLFPRVSHNLTSIEARAEAHRQLAFVDKGQCGRYKTQVPPGEGANQCSRNRIQNLKEA